ncbi:MAG: winged helix-turn-helix transcriptional regulator [Erysipelotrichaceae bacterium]|nr:winged helix-turn-helix transcriptional regulator [Erysipelotrichaceae bacterium]
MAIPTNIKTLLSGEVVEWARIEFKQTWDAATSLKTICAFANDLDNWGGGYIVIGVEEKDGRPVYPLKGVPSEKLDSYQKNIFLKCQLIRPAYTPIIGVETYQNKQFIVIWCPGGDNRPYSSPKTMAKDNKEHIHYIRKASNTVEPSDDEEKDLFTLANCVPFDDRVNHQADISDLNITLIQNYLKEVKSSLYEKSQNGDFIEVCHDMNIISNLPEYVKPKNVGLMFFSMEPDKFFPYTQIDVVQFPDGLGGNDIIENTFKGPIHQQLRAALQFIKNMIITEKVIKHPDRAEADRFFNYPFAAIEEALSNAVYHRAYDIREPIEVRVERDRIEIVSFPGPDRSVTQEGLKHYRVSNRRYRNRRIGDFLKELHLTEGRNTGFKKILDALEANGSPKPEFETDENHSYFISRLFIHEGFLVDENKRSQKGAKKEPKKGADHKQEILTLLEKNPSMTQVQLMEALGLSRKQVQTLIKELQEKHLLVREGSNRKGRWIVQKVV